MEYTIIVNGRSYDLPKKTLPIMEALDEVLKVDSVKGYTVKQKYEKLHTFMKKFVGEENAAEMLGSENLPEIDLSELTLAVKKVVAAYDKPIEDYNTKLNADKLANLPIDKIVSVSKAAQNITNIQGLQK